MVQTHDGSFFTIRTEPDKGKEWQDQPGNTSQKNGTPIYDGTQASWIEETIDLSDYVDESIKFRFRLDTDYSPWYSNDGYYFDDFKVNVFFGTSEIEEPSSTIQAYPVPCDKSLTLLSPGNNGQVEYFIANVLGQTIQTGTVTVSGNRAEIPTGDLQNGFYILTDSAGRSLKITIQHW